MILFSSSPISEHASLALASAGGVSPLVRDLGLCLVAAGLLAALFVRVRIPAIAALLVAGVALGPAGFEAVSDRASVDTIASLGLTLLLFVIGLEVNLGALLASGRTLLVTGALAVTVKPQVQRPVAQLARITGRRLGDRRRAHPHFNRLATVTSHKHPIGSASNAPPVLYVHPVLPVAGGYRFC